MITAMRCASSSAGRRAEHYASAYSPGLLAVKGRVPVEVLEALHKRGHTVNAHPDSWEGACLNGALMRDPVTGMLQAGSDPRGEAFAVAY